LEKYIHSDSMIPAAASWEPILDAAELFPITSVAPSTTSTALTSLWTGACPAEHGIIGYEMWLKEYGMIANMIFHSASSYRNDTGGLQRAGFRPDSFLTAPRLGGHLARNGVHTFAFQPQSITNSGLSTMLMTAPDVQMYPYRTHSDLWVTLRKHLAAHRSERTYHYIYWGALDELSHHFNPYDERVRLEFSAFGSMLGRFITEVRKDTRGDTLLLMTADHGHIPTPPDPKYHLLCHPDLTDCLTMLPTCEGRFALLYPRPGREHFMREYVEKTWPGEFHLFRSVDLMEYGVFGSGARHPHLEERLGEWAAIPGGNAYWWWPDKDNHLAGRHGGLTADEMIVPLVAIHL
jgi:predicted AlkP superfamily pyrophosphatase or phosphodiesterase